MPKLSERAGRMPASPIRKLAPYADAAKARGTRIFHLNIGQPDVESPPAFWEAVRRPDLRVLEYSHAAGLPELRERAAVHYRSIGIDVTAAQVLVCTAGSEAIAFAMMATMDPGDEVIVPEPMYANYIGFAAYASVTVRPVTTRIEDDFRLPGVDAFERLIGPKTRGIVVCNPGNPTGVVYTDAQLDDLRELALRHDLTLIADEVYRDFNFTDAPIRSVLQLPGLERHAVMCDSVSKRFSLCGARVGFLVTRNAELMDAAVRFAQARLSPPMLEQIGVLAAMETPPSYFEGVREEYRGRRDLLVERLRAMPGVVCPNVQGAFYATVRLPIDDADRFCQWLLESFELDGETVMLAPATGFYGTPGLGKDEVRVAYVLGQDRLARAMDVLEAALAAYPGRTTAAAGTIGANP